MNFIRRSIIEKDLDTLMYDLALRNPSNIVFNPYHSSGIIIETPQYNNLMIYLKKLLYNNADILLLGEAGGFAGLKHSGIPFTSTWILKHSKIFYKNRSDFDLGKSKIIKEKTATIVYKFFEANPELFDKCVMFNTFPFHPHEEKSLDSNRKPTKKEIREGKKYILQLFKVYEFKQAHGIGKIALKCLNEMREESQIPDIPILYIRHPSFGGKEEFMQNMNDLFDIRMKEPIYKDLSKFI